MEIEIKHIPRYSSSKSLSAESEKRKLLTEKYQGKPSLATLLLSIFILFSSVALYILLAIATIDGIGFFITLLYVIDIIVIYVIYKNIRTAIFGNGQFRTIILILSLISLLIYVFILLTSLEFIIELIIYFNDELTRSFNIFILKN